MCIIAICEKRKLTDEEFSACWESNGHGMGYAYWDGEKVISAKGFMEQNEAKAAYNVLPVPHVVHFRIASSGGICPELTHPFLCTANSKLFKKYSGTDLVLFHNGTLTDWHSLLMNSIFQTKVIPSGAMSDSRAMAMAVSVLGPRLLQMYSSQKWVVVSKDGAEKVGPWVESDTVFFSNRGFEPRRPEPIAKWYSSDTLELPWASRNSAYTGNRGCTTCGYYEGDMRCALKGELKDNWPCREYRPDDDYGISSEPKEEVGEDIIGARVSVDKQGKVVVEENFLQRLEHLSKKGGRKKGKAGK
jgi:hypothetical protein